MTDHRVAFGPFVFDRASATLWEGARMVALRGCSAAEP